MLDKSFYTYLINAFNNQHTQDIKDFKGNYVFVRLNDGVTMKETSSYNSYDNTDVQHYALAETLSTETPFTESNNRSGWTKQYAIMFPLRDKDDVLAALQEVRDWFRGQDTHSITDDGTTYKFVMKVSRPSFFDVSPPKAGKLFATYTIQVTAENVETGNYGNEAKHYLNLSTDTVSAGSFTVGNVYSITTVGTTDFTAIGASSNTIGVVFTATGVGSGTGNATELDNLIFDNVTISSATTFDPDNNLDAEENTTNVPTARATTFDMVINYDSGVVCESILARIEGKSSRSTKFTYGKIFDGVSRGWELYISNGSVVYQNGVLIQLKVQFVEV